MNPYVTAAAIKTLREQKGMTQAELAEMIGVTDKAVSKWETAKGLPDISLLEPLAAALGVTPAVIRQRLRRARTRLRQKMEEDGYEF